MTSLTSRKSEGTNELPRDWDVICVGAGISSLAFGAQLAKTSPELRLLIIEKHYVAGGYASVFFRRKKRFDCSLHKLSGMGAGGNLRRILFEDLELGDSLEPIVADDYFAVHAAGLSTVLPNSIEGTRTELLRRFPLEAAALGDFFEEVLSHGRNGYYQLQILNGTFEVDLAELRFAHRNLKNITVAEALAARFQDPLLREVLAAPGIYVGGFPEDLGYLYYLHVVYATLVRGNAYIKGSSQHLSNVLVKRIEEGRGTVLLKTQVQQVLCDLAGNVTGVETDNGSFSAPRVVINTSPHHAMREFFPGLALEGVKAKLAQLKPSRSTTTLYAVLDAPPGEFGLASAETMVFSGRAAAAGKLRLAAAECPQDEDLAEEAYWEASTMEVTNYHRLDPDGGQVICLNVLDVIEHWPARGGSNYREKKARATAVLTRRLIDAVPQLAGHVRFSEISSPRTYERYTNNTDGAGYGAMVGTDLKAHLFHYGFPIGGVDFLSAWVAGPSYEAAFGYAQVKAEQIGADYASHSRGRCRE